MREISENILVIKREKREDFEWSQVSAISWRGTEWLEQVPRGTEKGPIIGCKESLLVYYIERSIESKSLGVKVLLPIGPRKFSL